MRSYKNVYSDVKFDFFYSILITFISLAFSLLVFKPKMVNNQSKPVVTVRAIYNSLKLPDNAHPIGNESNIVFGNILEYTGRVKWTFIRTYILAMIKEGIIPYDFETAMTDLEHIDTAFKLQCNISMIEFQDGTIIYSIRVFTAQRNKKEDQMFVSLTRAKYLLLRGSFAIFKIKNGDTECIKVHPGMIKFENNTYTDVIGITDIKFASEKVDGINMNIGCVQLDNGDYILEIGNKDKDPFIVLIPEKNHISEMNTLALRIKSSIYSPHMVFNILTTLITKTPKLMSWLTKYTCVFELLNRHMFEIYIGSEFEKLKTPELILLRTYKSGINVPIPVKLQVIFRTPRLFVIGSDEYNNYMCSMNEGVVGLNKNGAPVVKYKTPIFALFQIVSKLFAKGHVNLDDPQDEFYNKIIELVMKKCHCEGTDPVIAKQFYIDYADMLSLIIYKIAYEFSVGNFSITDILSENEICNWGNIVSSVIKYYTDTLDPNSAFMKCYKLHTLYSKPCEVYVL